GLENLKGILKDLGTGTEINRAIEAHTCPLEQLERDFAAFVQKRAEQLAPGLDWEKPKLEDIVGSRVDSSALSQSLEQSRTNRADRPGHPAESTDDLINFGGDRL